MPDTPDDKEKDKRSISERFATEKNTQELKQKTFMSENNQSLGESLKAFRSGDPNAKMPGPKSSLETMDKLGEKLNRPVRKIQVENVPPDLPARPFPLAPMPETKSTNKTLSLPGAANGVFLLGGTLAIVAVWGSVIHPLIELSWYGKYKTTKGMTMPPSGIISLVLFILLITFISTLSPDFANVAFFFILALWAVYLVMNPQIVQTAASFVSQGNKPKPPDTTSGAGSHPTSH